MGLTRRIGEVCTVAKGDVGVIRRNRPDQQSRLFSAQSGPRTTHARRIISGGAIRQPRRRARCPRTLPRPIRRRGDVAEDEAAGRHLAALSGKFSIVREQAERYR